MNEVLYVVTVFDCVSNTISLICESLFAAT